MAVCQQLPIPLAVAQFVYPCTVYWPPGVKPVWTSVCKSSCVFTFGTSKGEEGWLFITMCWTSWDNYPTSSKVLFCFAFTQIYNHYSYSSWSHMLDIVSIFQFSHVSGGYSAVSSQAFYVRFLQLVFCTLLGPRGTRRTLVTEGRGRRVTWHVKRLLGISQVLFHCLANRQLLFNWFFFFSWMLHLTILKTPFAI